jgi:SAM-dependent methyltransferase
MPDDTHESVVQKYGDYAGFATERSPASVNHFGEDPLNEVKRLLGIYVDASSRILDIGCGAGQTLCKFAPRVHEAWGIDAASDLLARGRERVRSLGLTNVTLVEGDSTNPEDVAQLPDGYFEVAYTESGPGINERLVQKLTDDAYFLQEVGGRYSAHHLEVILGRTPFTNFAYHHWDHSQFVPAADLGLLPVCHKNYFWEVYFRDLVHLERYVSNDWALSDWRLSPRPYDAERDRPALELYARYNRTSQGIRILYHVQVLVWRRALIHYYPVDGIAPGFESTQESRSQH